MKKALLSLALLAAACLAASAIGVDVNELKGAGKIEFVNYTGPLNIFQTDLNIRGIGRNLARQVARGGGDARIELKYSAVHIVGAEEPEKFSADIISLDKGAKVDHINNVRRIVSAYIETLYGYPRKDADLLALFVSYYNAIYRRNLDY
ncbi:MAG: P83/100 family protein, partial [Spirochaetes bacterium]|nr:P83/100 family protein [Spirochaetota bacterium]